MEGALYLRNIVFSERDSSSKRTFQTQNSSRPGTELDRPVPPCLQVVRYWAHSRAQGSAMENTLPCPALQDRHGSWPLILILVNMIHELTGLGSVARLSLFRSPRYSMKMEGGAWDGSSLGWKALSISSVLLSQLVRALVTRGSTAAGCLRGSSCSFVKVRSCLLRGGRR